MKSSYSQETNCVYVRPADGGGVWLRETTAFRSVHIPAGSWLAFIQGVKAGDFDHLTEPAEAAPDDERAAYIRGLRSLAGWLAARPAAPVPRHVCDITAHVHADDDLQGVAHVHAVAEQLGLPVDDNGRLVKCRWLAGGGVAWELCYVRRAVQEEWSAAHSYFGAVQPAARVEVS